MFRLVVISFGFALMLTFPSAGKDAYTERCEAIVLEYLEGAQKHSSSDREFIDAIICLSKSNIKSLLELEIELARVTENE
ncbi:MAG: hypothetical protein AAGE89_13265, partial [Pseudomonadota bacterium]